MQPRSHPERPALVKPCRRCHTENGTDSSDPEPDPIPSRKVLAASRTPPQDQVRQLSTRQERNCRIEAEQATSLQSEDSLPGIKLLHIEPGSDRDHSSPRQQCSRDDERQHPGSAGQQTGDRAGFGSSWLRGSDLRRLRGCGPLTLHRRRSALLWQLSKPTPPPTVVAAGTGNTL